MARDYQWKRTIGFKEETDWGVEETDFSSGAIWLRSYGDTDLKMVPNVIEQDGTDGTRGKRYFAWGDKVLAGTIPDIDVRDGEFDNFLKWAIGPQSVNTYKPDDAGLKSFTIQERIAGLGFVHVGVKIVSITFTMANREILRASLNVVGRYTRKLLDVASLQSPTYSPLKEPFVMCQGTFTVGVTPTAVRSAEIVYDNGFASDYFTTGDCYTKEHPEGVANCTGNFILELDEATDFWHDVQNKTEKALQLSFTNGTDTWAFDLKHVILPEYDFDRGDQVVEENVSYTAIRSGSDMELEVTVT